MITKIKDMLMFWRWPVLIRSLSQQLTALQAEHDALKVEHQKVLDGQGKILEWVKTTHRLNRAPEGIRALIQSGRRIVPIFVILFLCQCLYAGTPPPFLRNSWTTNTAGTPVSGVNDLSITNAGSGTNWLFYGITPQTVARLGDISVSAGTLTTNPNQFLGVPLSIKSGALLTNIVLRTSTNIGLFFTDSLMVPTNLYLQGGLGTVGQIWTLTNAAEGTGMWSNAPTGGGGLTTNANQFLGVPLSIKDSASVTNFIVQTSLKISNGFVYASGPVTNGTQLNLPHLTVLHSAVINAQGDVTNSSDVSNWSLYPTNVWNDRQFGSQNLTNWSNIPTGSMANVVSTDYLTNWANAISNLANTKQFGSDNLTNWSNIPTGAMANIVSVTFLTNWANTISNYVTAATNSASVTNWITTRQPSSTTLSNLSGTGAITNLFNTSLSNATIKPTVFGGVGTASGMTNTTGQLYGVEAGTGMTITPNGSNLVFASTASGTVNFSDLVWTNDVGVLYPLIDRPRIQFLTNRIYGRLIRADGTNTVFGSNALPVDVRGVDSVAIGNDALGFAGAGNGSLDNVAIGHGSSSSNSGSFNVSIGFQAMQYNQFRSDNVAVGYQSLHIFDTGFQNTALGGGTMDLLDTSYDGTAVGWGAMDKLEGFGNTALGSQALLNAQGGGNYNLAAGFEALEQSDRLEGNVALGRGALTTIDDLTNVVAIGYQATALSGGLTNAVGIGALTRITADNQMMLGTNITRYVMRNVDYTFPNANGASGTVLTNDGSGILGWGAVAAAAAADAIWTNDTAKILFAPATATNRLQLGTNLTTFGGVSSAFPALWPEGTTLNARLADNSGFAPFTAGLIRSRTAGMILDTEDAANAFAYSFLFRKKGSASGTNATINGETELGNLMWQGFNGAGFVTGAGWVPKAEQTWVPGVTIGARMELRLAASNTLSAVEAFRFVMPFSTNSMMTFNGTNAASPALKRFGRMIQVRSADNTGFADFAVSNIAEIRGLSYVWPDAQGAAGAALTNDGAGNLGWASGVGAVKFSDLLWTNEPSGRIHPTTFTNRLEVQWPITIGTNTAGWSGPPDSNDILYAYRDITKGEGWGPRFEFGSFSNSVVSHIYANSGHYVSTWNMVASDENGNSSVAAIGTDTRAYPFIQLLTTNGFEPFSVLNNTNVIVNNITYTFPMSQGAADTVITNNGAGILGWRSRLAGAITNLFTTSLSNATIKPLVVGVGNAAGATNTTGQIRGLEAGGNVSLAENGSNVLITATLSGGGYATNANQFGPAVTLTLKDGILLTNLIVQTSLKVSNGFFYASGPVTNGTQLNLPHLTPSRSAVINAEGDVTNSSADANWSLYSTNVLTKTNTPVVAVGNLHVTNQLLRVNEEFNGGTVFTNLDFTGSIIKTMTNAITGSRTNNLTNAVGGASMIVYVVGETATATDRNYTFTAASANIRWMNSPTNANSIDLLIHSNQVYTFWFDVVTNATGPATNIIARWATDSPRPILNDAIPISAGAGTSNAWMEGRVFLDATTATTNHTGTANYTNLFTFTVPANTLTNLYDEVEFYLSGHFRFGTATTNGFKCIYGTSTLFDTGFITASNCPWKSRIVITRTGNSAQRVETWVQWMAPAAGSHGVGTVTTYSTNMPLAQVNGVTNIFAFQGQSRIPAAITNDYRLVRWNPGPRGNL